MNQLNEAADLTTRASDCSSVYLYRTHECRERLKSNGDEEPNDYCDSLEEDVALAIEHSVSNNSTSTQKATKTVVPLTTMLMMCIGLNNSRVEQFSSIDL
jgi:hypothetical protein